MFTQRFKDLIRMFYCINSSKQKSLHLSARELHNECSASISLKIICFGQLQHRPYEKFHPGIFLQEYVQPNAPQVATMMALWKVITVFPSSSWNVSSPHYVTCFLHQNLQKFKQKMTLSVPLCKISCENIFFCHFTK